MKTYHLKNRPDREITLQREIDELLKNNKYVVISMCRENEPYIVTLSYGYDPSTRSLYMHCNSNGLKTDFIKVNPNVCATIIEDGGYMIDDCTQKYIYLVFCGKIHILEHLEEKKYGMNILLNHLENNPDFIKEKMLKAD